MLKFAAALMACMSASAAAMAADLPNGNASPSLLRGEAAYNWSGIYAGASVGIAWDEISGDYTKRYFGTSKASGFAGGVQAGFNKQSGVLVVGVEADINLSNGHGDKTAALSGPYGDYTISGTGRLEAKFSNFGTIRARVGYAMDNTLVYATVGYAFARHELQFTGTFSGRSGASLAGTQAQAGVSSNTLSGIAFGGGVEYAFARGVSVKFEYLRVQFSRSDFFTEWATTTGRGSLSVLRTGVNFRI